MAGDDDRVRPPGLSRKLLKMKFMKNKKRRRRAETTPSHGGDVSADVVDEDASFASSSRPSRLSAAAASRRSSTRTRTPSKRMKWTSRVTYSPIVSSSTHMNRSHRQDETLVVRSESTTTRRVICIEDETVGCERDVREGRGGGSVSGRRTFGLGFERSYEDDERKDDRDGGGVDDEEMTKRYRQYVGQRDKRGKGTRKRPRGDGGGGRR